jgi:hypothetical protein
LGDDDEEEDEDEEDLPSLGDPFIQQAGISIGVC